MKEQLPSKILNKIDDEYLSIVMPIIKNDEFIRRKKFNHHENRSVYGHSLLVSVNSYYLAKKLGLDYRAAAIGGLLHDFYYKDWQLNKEKLPLLKAHGFIHASEALENSKKLFPNLIDKKVENIIPTTNTNGTVDYKYTYNYTVELKTKYHVFIGNSINGVVSAVHDAFKKAMQWYKAQGINFPVNAKNLKKKIISFITQNANDIEQGKKTKYTQMYFSVIDDEFLTEKELTAWVAYIVNSTAIL